MPVRIVVDERERNSNIPELLKNAGAVIDFTQLKVGDYVVSSETAVERKTVRDLISSIYDGRLFVQCSDLVKYYQKPLLVVQGNIAELAESSEDMEDIDVKLHAERMPIAYAHNNSNGVQNPNYSYPFCRTDGAVASYISQQKPTRRQGHRSTIEKNQEGKSD